MLKKLTLVATVLVMTTGLAQATPKGGVELTSAQLDTVSAGYYDCGCDINFYYGTTSAAAATSSALGLGQYTAVATATVTLAAPYVSNSVSSSTASSASY